MKTRIACFIDECDSKDLTAKLIDFAACSFNDRKDSPAISNYISSTFELNAEAERSTFPRGRKDSYSRSGLQLYD